MHIIYCIPSLYNSGGMERVLSLKANWFVKHNGWKITIITTSQKGRATFYPLSSEIDIIDLGIDYEIIASMPLRKKFVARRKAIAKHKILLEKILLKLKPDITVSMFTHEVSFLPKLKVGGKKLLELHFSKDFRQLDAKSKNLSISKRLILLIAQWHDNLSIKYYDKFVVLTNRDASTWNLENIEVIPNPTPFDKELNCDYTSKKVLAIGRLCPQKGFDMLVEAWAKIPSSIREGWTLEIVGSGSYENILHEFIKRHCNDNSIKILPPKKEISLMYSSHSIFCFPSRYEGFGMTLLEAETHGMPSVSFDCPCGPSDLIIDGQNGFLIPPYNIENFSEKLSLLITDVTLRESLGQNAKEFVKKNFSSKRIMQQWTELFQSMLKIQA